MNIMLNFMEKIYSDTDTLSIVYIVGAVLLFIFIVLLIFSLRKSYDEGNKEDKDVKKDDSIKENKKEEIIVEDKNEEKIDETINEKDFEKADKTIDDNNEEEKVDEQSIFEKTTIIPLDDVSKDEESKNDNVKEALDKVEDNKSIEKKENTLDESIVNDIPDVDEFVDSVVKKTYERSDQFSSVYVDNNENTIELNKVMDNVNVEDNVKKELLDESDTNKDDEYVVEEETATKEENDKPLNLDNLKKALNGDKVDVNLKQDELKNKLDNLKKDTKTSKEELLSKLNKDKEEE